MYTLTDFSRVNTPMPPHTPDNRRGSFSFVPVMALYAGLVAGTAGAYTPANLELVTAFATRPIVEVRGQRERRTASLQPALFKIRSTFGLTMTEFAEVFGVSRPTAYAWFDGALPKADLVDRIWRVHAFAGDVERLQIRRISLLKRKPIIDGLTLLDILHRNEGMDAGLRMLKQNSERSELKSVMARGKTRRRIYNAEDVSMTPHANS